MNVNGNVIEKLVSSKTYQDYERAFSQATGLPVALRTVESWQLVHRGKRSENTFCSLMAQKSRSCAACLQTQQRLADAAQFRPATVTCAHGMSDTAVPVRLGQNLIGFLQTGQVFRKAPTEAQFEHSARLLHEWGVTVERKTLHDAYFSAKVLDPKQHESVVKLLAIFAQHLSMISNQIIVAQQNVEPPVITRAKEYVQQNQGERLSLSAVAKAVHTSTFYFCKLFRKMTGLTFTHYVHRVRIEKAKNLLLNPNLRISEIGFEVGFQTETHFNRIFKRIVGQSPTGYRAQLRCA